MEIFALATTALSIATPFLEKIAEGTAKKIGEDVWNLIKKPFELKNKDINSMNRDELKLELVEILRIDPNFKNELETVVIKGQEQINLSTQNINNAGSIEKQINITHNSGSITM